MSTQHFGPPRYTCGEPYCPGEHASKYHWCTREEVAQRRAAVRKANGAGSNFQKYFGAPR